MPDVSVFRASSAHAFRESELHERVAGPITEVLILSFLLQGSIQYDNTVDRQIARQLWDGSLRDYRTEIAARDDINVNAVVINVLNDPPAGLLLGMQPPDRTFPSELFTFRAPPRGQEAVQTREAIDGAVEDKDGLLYAVGSLDSHYATRRDTYDQVERIHPVAQALIEEFTVGDGSGKFLGYLRHEGDHWLDHMVLNLRQIPSVG